MCFGGGGIFKKGASSKKKHWLAGDSSESSSIANYVSAISCSWHGYDSGHRAEWIRTPGCRLKETDGSVMWHWIEQAPQTGRITYISLPWLLKRKKNLFLHLGNNSKYYPKSTVPKLYRHYSKLCLVSIFSDIIKMIIYYVLYNYGMWECPSHTIPYHNHISSVYGADFQ